MPAKAIIAPHAGYMYSGPIAGTAFAAVQGQAAAISRVILLGPAHRYSVPGLAFPSADALATPVGLVPVDRALLALLADKPSVQLLDEAFDGEHALEVLLPFVRHLFPQAAVVPLLVGGASTALMADVLDRLWGGPETLIIISSDLSHFHGYDRARSLDAATAEVIETLGGSGGEAAEELDGYHACGHRAINGLLQCARDRDLRATALDVRNSGDIAGPRDRVVGYGAFAFETAAEAQLPDSLRAMLLDTLEEALRRATGDASALPDRWVSDSVPRPLLSRRSAFVTLYLDGQLRGCVGSFAARNTLLDDVVRNGVKAATGDPRFQSLDQADLPRVVATISVLSTPRPIGCRDEEALLSVLRPEIDGLILEDGSHRGLFLPKVWSIVPDRRQFVRQLKEKAGLPAGHWSPTMKAWRFSTESFSNASASDLSSGVCAQ